MSASEKLKALIDAKVWEDDDKFDVAFIAALPQIVAVVEAAEHSARALSEYGYVDGPVYSALTALDKALA